MIVRHDQLHPAERVRTPRRLAPADHLAAIVLDRDVALLAADLSLDALGHFPPGIEDDAADRGIPFDDLGGGHSKLRA